MFPGWIGWSKWYKKNWGVWPSKELVKGLAKLHARAREKDLELYREEIRKEEVYKKKSVAFGH